MGWIALACFVVAGGCGGGANNGSRDTTPDGPDRTKPAQKEGPAPDAKLTPSECGEMLDHIVDIAHEARKPSLKPDELPTGEQLAKIKEGERERRTEPCLLLPRSAYDCAMAARTKADLESCDSMGAAPPH